jgi:polar amino acid transport system ATP-binding protein
MLETIENGEILYMGKKAVWTENGKLFLAKKQQRREIESCFGLVFQNFNLFPHLTVERNLTIAPVIINKMTEAKAKEEARKILEEVGLQDKAKAYPNHLSGGQQQRVAIARELMMKPKILLYDEPTSALDPANVIELEKVVNRLKSTQITQFIVTHNIEFAINVADQIWFIEDGLISEQGSPAQLMDKSKTDLSLRDYFKDL